jgi:hypothetical protein
MLGVLPSGQAVVVERRAESQSHPLRHASIPEIRSTMVRTLRAAGHSWGRVAEIMRCSVSTCHLDAATPPIAVA